MNLLNINVPKDSISMIFDEFIDAEIYKLVTEKQAKKPEGNIENIVTKYKNLIDNSNIWLIYTGTLPDLSKLELTKDEQKIISDLQSILSVSLTNDFEIYKTFEKCKIETVILYAVLKNKKTAEHYINDLRDIKLDITGENLKELGINPSSEYQKCFDYILQKKLGNPDITLNDEITFAKEFFNL